MTSTDPSDTTASASPRVAAPDKPSVRFISAVGTLPLLSMVALPVIGESTAIVSEDLSPPITTTTTTKTTTTTTPDTATINARLQTLEQRHETTHQMIQKLTEMVGDLTNQLHDQRQLRSARGHGGGGPIRPRASANKKAMPPPAMDHAPRPRSGSTTQAALVDATALKSLATVVKKIQPPTPARPLAGEPGQGRHRSGSVTDMAMAAATVAVAKMSRAIIGRKTSTNAVVAAASAYEQPRRPPTLTRRFKVDTLQFNDVKMSKWRRFVRSVGNLFVRARGDSGTITPGPMRDDTVFLPYTIHHNSPARLVWDMLMMTLIIVDIIVTPLSLSFQYEPFGIQTFNTFATSFFSVDFAVQAFSSYATPKDVVVSGPMNTIPHYIFTWLALADFFAWFPFEVILPSAEIKLLGIAKVVRLIKLRQLTRRFNSSKKAGLFRMVRLFSIVFLVSHILACYWHWVAADWRQNEEGYLRKSLAAKYSHCWSLIIGSLNASPPAMYTPIEEISVAFFMLIGNVLQATVFGSVAVLISSFNEEEATYNKKIFEVYERCKLLDIPTDLSERIRDYYDHLFRETRSVDPDADSFIMELSPALISEVKFQLFREMITQIPFFSSASIDPVVIEMLILRLRTIIYMQDDVLIQKGEFGDWMGFVGSKGSVGVLDPNTNSNLIVRVLQKGEYFGELGLLHRAKRSNTYVALSWVQIHVLSRRDLDEVKEQYAEEAEGLEDEIERFMTTRVKIPHKDDAGPSKKIMKWLM